MGNIGPVALDAWYLDMQDVFDTYTLGALAKFDISDVKLSIGARHTELDLDDVSADDSLTKVELGAKMGIFGANVGYGWTDSEGGIGGLDNDAKTAFQGWTMNLNGVNDASLLKLNVNAQVLPSLNLALNYNVLDRDDESTKRPDTTDKEYYLQATYQMSKTSRLFALNQKQIHSYPTPRKREFIRAKFFGSSNLFVPKNLIPIKKQKPKNANKFASPKSEARIHSCQNEKLPNANKSHLNRKREFIRAQKSKLFPRNNFTSSLLKLLFILTLL
jgi:hypothetical protein